MRYADDFVVLARYQGERLQASIEGFIEVRMGLEINREKTRVVNLRENGASLDFLGYTFRYDRDLHGRTKRYLNLTTAAPRLDRCLIDSQRTGYLATGDVKFAGNLSSHIACCLIGQLVQGLRQHLVLYVKGEPLQHFPDITKVVSYVDLHVVSLSLLWAEPG